MGEIVELCRANQVTDMIVVHETRGEPDGLCFCSFSSLRLHKLFVCLFFLRGSQASLCPTCHTDPLRELVYALMCAAMLNVLQILWALQRSVATRYPDVEEDDAGSPTSRLPQPQHQTGGACDVHL